MIAGRGAPEPRDAADRREAAGQRDVSGPRDAIGPRDAAGHCDVNGRRDPIGPRDATGHRDVPEHGNAVERDNAVERRGATAQLDTAALRGVASPGNAVGRRDALGLRDVPDQRDIRLYDATDIPWIATVVDHVVDARGEPWRILRERLEHSSIRAPRVAAILGALRRVLGGKAERARIARRVRALVLGHAALDDRQRAARLVAASEVLGLDPAEVDQLMWIDLATERPVTLPDGRPDERRLAAYANLDRIQRAVRRARELRLVVWGEAHELIRTAKRYGLLVSVSRSGDATALDVVGPLSLFHDTGVYGGALAGLIPLLADVPRFELTVHCDFGYGPSMLRVTPPVLLPPVVPRGKPSMAARLVRELAKAAPELRVECDPPPIANGAELSFPDLAIDHAGSRTWIELIGFATAEYVTAQRARYTAAGITNVLLCVHDKRRDAQADDDPQILRFHGRLSAAAVLAKLGEAR